MVASDSVCVVGAGPAGLVTARVFLQDGFDVTVFEKYDEVGGTWSSYHRYLNLNHQQGKGIFEFSELPFDEGYVDAESVQDYLAEYADRFDVTPRIEFETEVASLQPESDGWTVEIRQDGDTEKRRFDYVVVCAGLHHVPKIPDLPGLDEFDGVVVHSSEVDEPDVLEGRRVVVVGGGKSAYDLSIEAARAGTETTMVFRGTNWMLPKRIFGGRVPHRFLYYTRVMEAGLPRYYNDDCVRLLDRMPEWLKLGIGSILQWDAIRSAGLHRVDDDLVPDTTLGRDIEHLGIMPEGYVDRVEAGEIEPVLATVDRVEADGVQLSTGDFVEADALVFATGHRKEFPFFGGDVDLKTDEDRFYLYRSLVPPDVENLGFVGTRQTFSNLLMMEISAHWLAAYFQDELVEMPPTPEMYDRIDRRLEWQEETLPNTEGFDFGPYNLHCADELLIDMGVSTRRSNVLAEYFTPAASARRYAGLHEERKRAAARSAPQASPGSTLRSTVSQFLP